MKFNKRTTTQNIYLSVELSLCIYYILDIFKEPSFISIIALALMFYAISINVFDT